MPIKLIALSVSIVLLVACGNKATIKDGSASGAVSAVSGDTLDQNKEMVPVDVQRGWHEDNQFRVDVISRFDFPPVLTQDSTFYLKANLVRLTNRQTGKSTALTLTDPCGLINQVGVTRRTEDLKWKQPLFQLDMPDCDDWWNSEFVAYENDSLKLLFSVRDVAPARLTRISENVLAGKVRREEELTGAWGDYQLLISLPDYSQKIIFPDREKLNHPTIALDDIHGESVADSRNQITIRKGTPLTIDSIFRDQKKVRIRTSEEWLIDCPFDELEGKLQKDNAG